MKTVIKLVLAVALLTSVTEGAPTKRMALTIASGQITGTLTGFVYPVRETHNDFKTVVNGGFMSDNEADDLRFWSDEAATTTIPHKLTSYNPTTGAFTAWVRCQSCAVGTIIYATWGDSAITTSQEDNTGLWASANWRAIYHLDDDPNGTAPQATDSSATGLHLTKTASPSFGAGTGTVASVAGLIATAYDFSPQNQYSGYMYESSANSGVGSNNLTLSGWIKIDNNIAQDTSQANLFGLQGGTYPNKRFSLILTTAGKIKGQLMGDLDSTSLTTTTFSTGTWYHVAMVYDYVNVKIYVNGAPEVTDAATFTAANDVHFFLNSRDTAQADIELDEVRLATTDRSAAWIEAEFNSQKPSSAFYTRGSTETIVTRQPVRHDAIKIGKSGAGVLDVSDAGTSRPITVGATLPTPCSDGQMHFKSDEAAGENVYGCLGNTWTHQGGTGSSDISAGVGITISGSAPQVIAVDTATVGQILTATGTLNYGSIAAHDCETLTISLASAAVGNHVEVGYPAGTPAAFLAHGKVETPGVATVFGCNLSASSISVSSGSFTVTITRPF